MTIKHAAFSEQIKMNEMEKGDKRFGIAIGYGENHKIPADTTDLFSFTSLKVSLGKRVSTKVENLIEVSYTKLSEIEDNSAVWLSFGHRRYLKVSPRTALGVQFNFGVMSFKHKVAELGTNTNFTEQLGLVYDYVVSEKNTLSLEYKFSHISNAHMKLPNVGINASMISLGYNWYY